MFWDITIFFLDNPDVTFHPAMQSPRATLHNLVDINFDPFPVVALFAGQPTLISVIIPLASKKQIVYPVPNRF
jgi:hypothetical protein